MDYLEPNLRRRPVARVILNVGALMPLQRTPKPSENKGKPFLYTTRALC
jgi:hypothetical protein